MIQQKYGKGEDPFKVHEDVALCVKHINILENMTLKITLPDGTVIEGKLDVGADHCTLGNK